MLQTGHVRRVSSMVVAADGSLIATADGAYGDATIKLWQASTGRQLRTLTAHAGDVHALAFSADGRQLASAHDDETIRVWDVATGREERRFYVPIGGARDLIFSPDHHYLVSYAPIGLDKEPNPELKRCPNVVGKPGFCEARDITVWNVRTGRFMYNVRPSQVDRRELAGA